MNRVLSFMIFYFLLSGDADAQHKHLSLGVNHVGVCIGNSAATNGFRLNLWDRQVRKVNGMNLSFRSKARIINGISTGILISSDTICNGIKVGGLVSFSERSNGLSVGGLAAGGSDVNGICIGGGVIFAERMSGVGISCVIIADTMKGLFVGLHGLFSGEDMGHLTGVSCSLFVSRLEELKGISVAALTNIHNQHGVTLGLYNYTDHLYGIQVGLWNVAKNKKHFKRLPFINFNFRKSRSQE